MPTNGEALSAVHRIGGQLCEWSPKYNRPARLSDEFHSHATILYGGGEEKWRLCQRCASMKMGAPGAPVTVRKMAHPADHKVDDAIQPVLEGREW